MHCQRVMRASASVVLVLTVSSCNGENSTSNEAHARTGERRPRTSRSAARTLGSRSPKRRRSAQVSSRCRCIHLLLASRDDCITGGEAGRRLAISTFVIRARSGGELLLCARAIDPAGASDADENQRLSAEARISAATGHSIDKFRRSTSIGHTSGNWGGTSRKSGASLSAGAISTYAMSASRRRRMS
jgi:hypothetical protein